MSLLFGDCIDELKKIESCSVDLVYLDPPFFTQKKQTLSNREDNKFYSFDDTWDDIDAYKLYMIERIKLCKKVLKDTGSMFLHCDKSASHYLRIALDDVFGCENFQSEIIWSYRRWSNSKKGLLNAHQVIYFYSKSGDFKFFTSYQDYSPTTNIDQIFQLRMRNENGKAAYKKDVLGNNELMEEKRGVPLSDVWEIPYLNPKANERVGYPTQKPILLLERIIELVTERGDLVLDPFCGSGTTLVAAKLLERRFIGIDISKAAMQLASERIANPVRTESILLKRGKDHYQNQDGEIIEILKRIGAVPVQRNKGIDGFLNHDSAMLPIPIRIQRENEDFEEAYDMLLRACSKNGFLTKVLIKNVARSQALINVGDASNQVPGLLISESIDDFIKNRESILHTHLTTSANKASAATLASSMR